ncbi:MAG: cytochrome-c peroxidase [Planctomycetota bacterium]|nr:MAG: cytochrome-c peroxidase [Planctomycetota bacterium]
MSECVLRREVVLGLITGLIFVSASPVSAQSGQEIAERVRKAIEQRDESFLPPPLTEADFPPRDPAKEALGRLLFHDKILSGNMNISCATCHHPLTDTGDGLSLPVGEGGMGLGVIRNTGVDADAIHERVPRNAPPLFNLGALEVTRMFHDGRVEVDPTWPSGFFSPAFLALPLGLDSVLAAQAMFPVTSDTEMAGQLGESPIGDAATFGNAPLIWEMLAQRIRDIPEYVDMFIDAFDDVNAAEDITMVHIANAIAAWEDGAFRAFNTPFDRYLRGQTDAMSESAIRGMNVFYNVAHCADCHSGPLLTDQEFHAIAMPQIGPGKEQNLPGFVDGRDDLGREGVTGDPNDRLKFRTPPLRNVALTGPWGHNGAYNTLEAVVRHHLNTDRGIQEYDTSQAVLPSRPDLDAIDFECHNDLNRRRIIMEASELRPGPNGRLIRLSDQQFSDLIDFLHALTDPASVDLRHTVPMSVPSGLPVFE